MDQAKDSRHVKRKVDTLMSTMRAMESQLADALALVVDMKGKEAEGLRFQVPSGDIDDVKVRMDILEASLKTFLTDQQR